MIKLIINKEHISVESGTSVAAAVTAAGGERFRRSITGESRGPLCGMGICFECRVTIDGEPLQRSCLLIARDGMEIMTDE